MRCGLPRIMKVLSERGLGASVAINAACLETHASACEAMRDAGWEFLGHGVQQRAMSSLADPGAAISESLARLEAFTGRRPHGWLGPGSGRATTLLNCSSLRGWSTSATGPSTTSRSGCTPRMGHSSRCPTRWSSMTASCTRWRSTRPLPCSTASPTHSRNSTRNWTRAPGC